ncbi:MAG: hypothetical protein Q8L48_23565 [Archangium sp.]|nr:hypothetical protein [Archangium sp.]
MRGALLPILCSSAALACSGPGAAAAMRQSTLVGWVCLLVSAALTVVAVIRRLPLRSSLSRVGAVVGVVVLLIHPGFWLSATIGDCGQSRLFLSPLATLLHAAVVGYAMLRKV